MDLKILHRKGKNSKFLYYLKNTMRVVQPRFMLSPDIDRLHDIVDKRQDNDYIYERVNYYNKLAGETALTGDVCSVGNFHLKGNRSAYFFDTYEYVDTLTRTNASRRCSGILPMYRRNLQ